MTRGTGDELVGSLFPQSQFTRRPQGFGTQRFAQLWFADHSHFDEAFT